MKVIDGTNLIMGRLCARVSKDLLKGEQVTITNPDKIIISGGIDFVAAKYTQRRDMQNKATPEHTPKWPRPPNMLLRKIMSGMMPKKTSRGRQALKRLRITQAGMSVEGASTIKEIDGSHLTRSTTLGAVCKRIGWIQQ